MNNSLLEEISNNLDEIRKELRVANHLKLADILLEDAIRSEAITPWVMSGRELLLELNRKLEGQEVT